MTDLLGYGEVVLLMAEFKELMQETKSSLQDLEILLQKMKNLDAVSSEQMLPSREDVQAYLETIIKAIEELPDRLSQKETFQQSVSRNLHLKMEKVLVKIERTIDQLDLALNCNPQETGQIQRPREEQDQSNEVPADRPVPSVSEYLTKGRLLLETSQYEDCLKLMTLALTEHPRTEEVRELVAECRRRLEEQRLQEELVIHIEDLKKEAMDQFDREKFQECAKTFAFLCQLDPNDRVLQDYLKLSQLEMERVASQGEDSAPQLNAPNTLTIPEAISSSTGPETLSSERFESNEVFGIADQNQVENVEAKDNSLVSSPQGEVSDGEAIKHWTSTAINWKALSAAGFLIALALMLGTLKFLKAVPDLGGTLIVQSGPSGSTTLINGVVRGQTPLVLQSLEPGTYDIRIQKDGYLSYSTKVTLLTKQPGVISARLETWPGRLISENTPSISLKSLSAEGNLIETLEVCERVLKLNPKNRTVSSLKTSIQNQLFEQIDGAVNDSRWKEAQERITELERVSVTDRAARRRLKLVKAKLQANMKTTVNSGPSNNVQVEELQRRILSAIASANYFPPRSGNALESIKSLKQLTPQSTFAAEKLDLIRGKTSSQAQLMIKAGNLEGAKALLRQLETYFPDQSELGVLRESLRSQEVAVAEINTSVSKAEAALESGHFIMPFNESAFSLSDRVLELDPDNQRAQSVRKDSLARALGQAKSWTTEGKYNEARQVYFTASQILSTHKDLPFSAQNVRDQLELLEFVAFPVIHDHTLGSCTGTLKFNGYVIAFVPTGASKDGFEQNLSAIEQREVGDKLKLHLNGKTYRFSPGGIEGKEEGRQKMKEMFDRLNKLIEK